MNITLEKNEGAVSGKLIVNIVKDDYADKLTASLKKLKQRAQMPGFRKGMVPMSLIQKMYGTEVKAEELQKVLADSVNLDRLSNNPVALTHEDIVTIYHNL